MKKSLLAIILIFALVFLPKSYDYTEPEDRVIVTCLALGEKDGNINLAAEVKQSDSSGKLKISVIISEAADTLGAISRLQHLSGGRLFLSGCPIILLESGISQNTIKDFLYFAFESNDIPLAIKPVYCKDAIAVLSEKREEPLGSKISKLLSKNSMLGFSETQTLIEIINLSQNKNAFCLPVLSKEQEQLQITGLYLYGDFKDIIYTDIQKSRILFAFLNKLESCTLNLKTQSVYVSGAKYKNGRLTFKTKGDIKDKQKAKAEIEQTLGELLNNNDIRKWILLYGLSDLPFSVNVELG